MRIEVMKTMIKVTIDMSEGISIKTTGHANYAPYGEDIVCAGVSAILQTAVLGLENIAENYPSHVEVIINR